MGPKGSGTGFPSTWFNDELVFVYLVYQLIVFGIGPKKELYLYLLFGQFHDLKIVFKIGIFN